MGGIALSNDIEGAGYVKWCFFCRKYNDSDEDKTGSRQYRSKKLDQNGSWLFGSWLLGVGKCSGKETE
jgi:hypothetical protein